MNERTESMLADFPHMMHYLEDMKPIELLILLEIVLYEFAAKNHADLRSAMWDMSNPQPSEPNKD